jgi:hypothetical protein
MLQPLLLLLLPPPPLLTPPPLRCCCRRSYRPAFIFAVSPPNQAAAAGLN